MTRDILVYRMIRLWKVAALGALAPIATVWAASLYHGADFPVLMVLALCIPMAHALRYPGMWHETLTVSFILSLCLCFAAMMDADLTTGAVIHRIFWLSVMALILFMMVVTPMAYLAMMGPNTVLTARATRRSPLDAETLRAAMTLYPGKEGAMATCGPADNEGRFSVTLIPPEIETLKYQLDDCAPCEDAVDTAPFDDNDDNLGCTFQAVVHESGPDRHEIFTYFSPEDVGVQRHIFKDLGSKGTEVTIEETGHHLTLGQVFGFWLTDYMADYLTHEMDMAEGRNPRANRAFPQKQLVVDLANLILPVLGGSRIEKTGA